MQTPLTDAIEGSQPARGPLAARIVLGLLRGYKILISPLFTGACRFQPSSGGPSEAYSGVQNRIGLDIGITAGGVLAWGVFAQTATPITRGALAGRYGGASGDIGVGLGVGANVLFGGSNNTISLQPLSLEGSVSLNLALGIAGLTLTWVQ